MDPSEIESTYNIRKQQTQIYWVCSWELMERATILTPNSTGKPYSAFHQNPIFLKDKNMKTYQHYIDAQVNKSKTCHNQTSVQGHDIIILVNY